MKRCRDCGGLKPLTAFPPSKKNRDGRTTYCRPCSNIRARRSREKRREAEGRTVRRRPEVPAGMKYCPACQDAKSLSEFPRNRSHSSGYASYCKPCHNRKGRETYVRLYGSTREYHL